MFPVGIDWSEKYLDYCIKNETGDVIKRGRVDNNEDGFNILIQSFLDSSVKLADFAVAIESPHQLVVDFLLSMGVSVYPVNPASIRNYRKSVKASGSKSDQSDAELISNYIQEHKKTVRVWHIPEPKLRQLKILVSDREKIVEEKVRLQNQLRSTLLSYFPQSISTFDDITCQTALDFLEKFPTYKAIEGKTEEYWNLFLDEHRVFNPKARHRFLSAILEKPITLDEAVVNAKSLLVVTIVSQLRSLIIGLKEY